MIRSLLVIFRETRPQFLVLTPACFIVGLGTASYVLGGIGKTHLEYVVIAFVGAVFSHIATNVLNDYFDYRSGLDLRTQRTPFSGGSGILPEDAMQPRGVLALGTLSLLVVAAVGIYFLKVRGWGILPLGIIGIVVIIAYTPLVTKSPFFCLVAPGLGFGPLMVMGTHYVLTGRYDWIAFHASLVPGFLVSNLLLLNQFPDSEADKTVDRRHLPIAIGKRASSYVYAVMALCAFGWVLAAKVIGLFPTGTLLSLLPLPLAMLTIRGVIHNAENTNALVSFLGKNVMYTLTTPFLLGLGFLIPF